jgi:hypothetical protein
MKGIQPESLYWSSRCFGQGSNRKYYNPARIETEMLSTCSLFTKGKKYIKLMLNTLFSAWRHSNAICCEKCSVCNDVLENLLHAVTFSSFRIYQYYYHG